jgi:S-adenosylmethionine/arginine decarboxylase-like enzyme
MSEEIDCKKPFHKHLMLRGYCSNPPKSTEDTIIWLRGFVWFLGMKILQGPFSSYVDVPGNRGITAVAMIETSHIAFHIWDESDPALIQLDVYTCGSLDVDAAIEKIASFFRLTSFEYLVYDRENGFDLIRSESVN